MKINRLYIQGFKSFTKEQLLDINNLDNGLIFVSGENKVEPKLGGNGVGKSALFEALSFVFFGKTSTNLKAGDIKNWYSTEKCAVTIEFERNGEQHTLTRTWNPNTLVLDSRTVAQDEVNDLIGMNFESFSYSVFISQFGQKFLDFTPSEKLNIFTSILEDKLKEWDSFVDKATLNYKSYTEEVSEIRNSISELNGKLSILEKNDYSKLSEEWENYHIEKVQSFIDTISINKAVLEGYSKELKEKNKELKKLGEDFDESVLDEIEENIKKYTNQGNEYAKTISGLNTEIRMINKDLKDLQGLGNKCPTCKQKVDGKVIKTETDVLKEQISNTEELLNGFIKKEKEIAKSLSNEKNKKVKEIEKLNKQEREINDLDKEVTVLENDIVNCKDRIDYNSIELEKEKNNKNPYIDMISDNDSKVKMLKRKLLYQEEELDRTKRLVEIYKYWQKGFKDIKLMLTSEALDEFEIEINNNLQNLGLADWKVKLLVDTETKSGSVKRGFNIFVKSPVNENLVPFDCWSGGEGQRIRIATTLGLVDFISNKRGSLWNILVLDEISRHLSTSGIEDVIYLLRNKALENNMKIFYIDHKDLHTYGGFTSTINIIKDDKGSKINYEA
jgi:DNA repair exonuclease SbcCD ATPase subunit